VPVLTGSVFLIGGGREPDGVAASHAPFVAACDGPIVAISLDDPDRWADGLRSAGAASVRSVVDRLPTADELSGAGGVYVGGGWTPGYQELLAGWSPPDGVPYAGFSAGAAVAAANALVGGWRVGGRMVADEDAGEDLDELEVRRGLGLVPFTVDVHATQWGTLTRLVWAVHAGLVSGGLAIDEHTCVEARGEDVRVHGWGAAYRVGLGAVHVLTA
jgi:cyanophycinase